MFLGPRPGYMGQPRRIKRRATYEEVRRFRNSREFRTWWEEEEGRNWKINSRHPHMRGTVEYWRCGFLQGRRYTCLARLRITIAYDDRYVIVSRSRDHPHNHQPIQQVHRRSAFWCCSNNSFFSLKIQTRCTQSAGWTRSQCRRRVSSTSDQDHQLDPVAVHHRQQRRQLRPLERQQQQRHHLNLCS